MTLKDRGLCAPDVVRHFKGGTYIIIGTATHTETGERLVLYSAILERSEEIGIGICARPEEMFCSEVDRDKYPNAEQTYRFEKVE